MAPLFSKIKIIIYCHDCNKITKEVNDLIYIRPKRHFVNGNMPLQKEFYPLKILIDISKTCVHGGARKAYEKVLAKSLKATPNDLDNLELEVEALKNFLERVDFPCLRSLHPALAGGQEKHAIIHFQEPDKCWVEVAGEKIAPPRISPVGSVAD
ncbi:MAG: hypothetical protein JEZ02_04585 [Desulfatibacillum sp.]|nr:hypothetical protein [Desulfatibacillum sp.]